MKTIITYIFLGLSLNGVSQISQATYDELRDFTTRIISPDNHPVFFTTEKIDSIIQVSDGVNIKLNLIKEQASWENGNLKYIRYYQEDKPYGNWQYFTPSGRLQYSLSNYAKYFVVNLHYSNYNVRSTRKFNYPKNKIVSGCSEENYYPNGSMQSFGSKTPIQMVNHWELVEDHKWHYFHPSGKLESVGKFKHGMKQGKWTYFNNTGEKIREVKYKSGLVISQKEI